MDTPLIELRAIRKSYTFGKVGVTALRKVTMEIDASEFVALSGALDTGKTTLLNLIGSRLYREGQYWEHPGRGLSIQSRNVLHVADLGVTHISLSALDSGEFVLESPEEPEHNATGILRP